MSDTLFLRCKTGKVKSIAEKSNEMDNTYKALDLTKSPIFESFQRPTKSDRIVRATSKLASDYVKSLGQARVSLIPSTVKPEGR